MLVVVGYKTRETAFRFMPCNQETAACGWWRMEWEREWGVGMGVGSMP